MKRKRNPLMPEALETSLADATALSLQAKQSHWNVKGPAFQSLHELFDKIHAMADQHADALGERLVQLGRRTRAFDGLSSLPGLPADAIMGREHAEAMAESLRAYVADIRALAAQAEEARDAATVDLAGEVLRDAEKQLWFVESHLTGDLKFNGRRGAGKARNADDGLRAIERDVQAQFGSSGDVENALLERWMIARARAGVTEIPQLVFELTGKHAMRSRRPWLAQPGDERAQDNLRAWREAADLPLLVNVNDMLAGYIEAALWSSNDESTPSGGVPLDRNYGHDDFSPASIDKARKDVELFALLNDTDMRETGATDEQHGHDLWLTRNGHGAGFWDRDYDEPMSTRLTESAKAMGELNIVVGDDGQLHCE